MEIVYSSDNYVPLYQAHLGDSGADLVSTINETIWPFCYALVPTGVVLELPLGYEGQIRGKSGLASKGIIVHWGTIDSTYRGKIKVIMYNFSFRPKRIKAGDRIAQLVIAPVTQATFALGEVNKNTERGDGGFGSTGR